MEVNPIKNRFFYLLISLLLFFLINPFFIDTNIDTYIFGLLFTIVLIVSVYAIEHSRTLIIIAGSLALLAIIGHWIASLIYPNKEIYLIDYIVTILFLITITITVLSYVIHDEIITSSTLYGAICGYLLIGLTWAFIFILIYTAQLHSFSLPASMLANSNIRTQQFIYYSFVTISTLGYGDITPLTNIAKTFSWLEAITGQVYLTVWIAQLVGLHIAHKRMET